MSFLWGSNDQTVTQVNQLPDWVVDFSKSTLNQADTVAGELTPPYQGQRVAGLTGTQQNALGAAGNVIGRNGGVFDSAMGGAAGVMGYNPQQVQAGSFLGGDIGAYMSPYTSQVEDFALHRLDEQRQRGLNTIGDRAATSGAFGGSRHGVAEGVLNSEAARDAGALSAGLRDQAFTRGADMMQADLTRGMQAQELNQRAGLQGAGLNLQAAGAMGQLASADQATYLQGTQAALAAGNQQQAQQQLGLDAAQQMYNETRGYPIEQLDIRLNALGMVPYGSTSSTTTPYQSNYGMAGLGGALAGAQLAGMLPGVSGGMGALAGGALGLLSDPDEKTDVKKVGDDPGTGLGLYAFRYKGDPKNYPKTVGYMADEVEKKYPDKVVNAGGKKIIKGVLG